VPEHDRLTGCVDEIDGEFIGREATPRLLLKLSIQSYPAELSLSSTVSFLEAVGGQRVRSTVHSRVHQAGVQPAHGRYPAYVVVDETAIQPDDQRYWLYAAVDPDTNELLHTKLEPTRTNGIAYTFFVELREKREVGNLFFVDSTTSLDAACSRHGIDFRYERHRD